VLLYRAQEHAGQEAGGSLLRRLAPHPRHMLQRLYVQDQVVLLLDALQESFRENPTRWGCSDVGLQGNGSQNYALEIALQHHAAKR
jgi:hypothetical protein